MKLFTKSYDGGENSGVTGYFLIEWKNVFSIVLLNLKRLHQILLRSDLPLFESRVDEKA